MLSTRPKVYVLLNSRNVEVSTLRSLFSKHGQCGALGVVVEEQSECTTDMSDGTWAPVQGVQDIAYYTSTSLPETSAFSLYVPTTAGHAGHLNAIADAGLRPVLSATLDQTRVLYILESPTFVFPPTSSRPSFAPGGEVCKGNIPTLDEWRTLWKAWDTVTLKMIPEEMLHQKPIDLRHKCLFYIGHIPTFVDMLLSKSIGGAPSEPAYFWKIFERGIDPHVDDPTHCHNHSEVPEKDEDWPTLTSILAFRDRVRQRLINVYDELESGKRTLTRNLARTLVMTLEHEGFHVETLLYMLIQRAGSGTLPPPGFCAPEWAMLRRNATFSPQLPLPVLGPCDLTVGHDDSEADDKSGSSSGADVVNHTYGWDNESPARVVHVGAFKAEWGPVTNMEYLAFWTHRMSEEEREVPMPKSWVKDDESADYMVRTLYGPVRMDIAGDWPVLASYDELEAYAKWKGGRLATEPELRLFLDTYDSGYEGGANVGFRNWHPIPSTMGLASSDGKGSNGGVWEWTSTPFESHPGLVPTDIFTGYSADFFDGKHHVVLGASYATIPRLTRRTVRNFYQHNYPYPWASARVVYDVKEC